MPKFLFQASLTADGVAGVLSEDGTARREIVGSAIESVGGTLEAFYFAFVPDQEAVRGLAMQVLLLGPYGRRHDRAAHARAGRPGA